MEKTRVFNLRWDKFHWARSKKDMESLTFHCLPRSGQFRYTWPAIRLMKPLPYRLFVCGKHEVRGFATSGLTHILSLEDPETPKETPAWFNGVHVQLHFHDVESAAEARTLTATAPTRDHVAEILQFGQRCLASCETRRPPTLLVHCFAGASRSTAAAYALACQALGKGKEAAALEYVLHLRPEAFPNLLVVKHADELLVREGDMVRALAPLRESFSRAVDEWIANQRRNREE